MVTIFLLLSRAAFFSLSLQLCGAGLTLAAQRGQLARIEIPIGLKSARGLPIGQRLRVAGPKMPSTPRVLNPMRVR